MLELEDWLETSPDHNTPLSKTVRKSPQVWKLASYVAIPASAALGYAGIPSPKVAVSAMGALATGMVGWVGRNKMTNVLSSSVAARPAIVAKLIECGLSNPSQTAKQIQSIRKEYHVHPEDFGALCTDVYKKYFLGMIKFDTQPRTSELTELENLKEALMLDNIAVGEAHMLAASDWFREACLFKTQDEWDDEDSSERKTIHKILYLTERALRQNQETDGAFLYEMTRTAQVFNITYYDALERIEDVAEAFYERALWNVRQKVLDTDQVSASTLERARLTLGVTPQMGFDLHEAALHEEVQSLLKGTTTSRQPNYNNEDDDEDDVILDPKTATFPEGTLERVSFLRNNPLECKYYTWLIFILYSNEILSA
jgi:Chloroplast envelope transporter